jgi:hypothetical protein
VILLIVSILVTCTLVACKDKPSDDNTQGDGNNTNGDDTNNNDDTEITPLDIITGLTDKFKITCKMTYTDPDFQYMNEEFNIYKDGNAFLTEENDSDGYLYRYYKKSTTTDYWAEFVLPVDEEAWSHITSDQTADTLLDVNGIDLLGYILYYFFHPSYGHKDQAELVSTEVLTIGDVNYTCNKYAYSDAIFGTNKAFWIVNISGVDYCLKYTTDSYSVEVTAYQTTNVAFPDTKGIALPEDKDIPWEDNDGEDGEESSDALLLSLHNGTINGLNATIEVAHDEDMYAFANQFVRVSKGAVYTVYDDEALTVESNWWNLPVQDGSNIYYVEVVSEDRSKSTVYTLNIFKNHYVKISYMSEGVEVASEQKVTHTTLGWGPKAYRRGYILNGWGSEGHYITGATSFNANWLKLDTYIRVNDLERPDTEGEYVFFGEYPQTLKEADVTVGDTPDINTGHYLGSDGFYYARVLEATTYSHYTSYKFDDGTSVEEGKTYYFKVEPIKWRILEIVEGKALLLSETILDFTTYSSSGDDYANSSVRAWLTNDFYYSALKDTQRSIIHIKASIGDTIFLPSYEDVVNPEYGFNSNPNAEQDSERGRHISDYLKARGLYVRIRSNHIAGSGWWTRTPYDSAYDPAAYCVSATGRVGYALTGDPSSVGYSGYSYGLVPAVVINMS